MNIIKTGNYENTINARKQLPDKMLMVLVAILASFPPMSTDLYLPALPTMSEQLKCSAALLNISLVVFFILISISSIIWGPLSDKYGRRRILMIGMPVFILSSLLCALSQNVYQLIASRILQAIGAGAAMAVNLAIVKDVFPGKRRERTLAIISVLNGMVPAVAPSIGSLIIRFTSWRGTFSLLAIIGCLVWICVFFFKETNAEFTDLSLSKTVLRLMVVLKNVNFSRLLLMFSVTSVPLLGFVGVSSFIFIRHFGVSKEAFSLYFGFNAVLSMAGGPIYLMLQKYLKPLTIIKACLMGAILSGVLILTIGQAGPMLFALSIACGFLSVSISRPSSNSLLLEQQDTDVGSASSLIQAATGICGSAGLLFVSYEWSNRITVLGIMSILLGLSAVLLWIFSISKCRIPKHFK
jgi:MFS transporter, DHA1 family, multidrug resistance protein